MAENQSNVSREDKTGELRLNFDESFYSLLNENEKLMKLDIPLPSINQFLVKSKTWFYEYRSRIQASALFKGTVSCNLIGGSKGGIWMSGMLFL